MDRPVITLLENIVAKSKRFPFVKSKARTSLSLMIVRHQINKNGSPETKCL